MKKVLFIITNHFAPDVRVEKEAASLVRAGYQVEIHCFGDDSLPVHEEKSGYKIHRPVSWQRGVKRSTGQKLWSFVRLYIAALKKIRKFDIIHCNDLETLPLGILFKIFSFGRVKIVYDAHEYQIERSGMKGVIKTVAKLVEGIAINFSDEILTVSDPIAAAYKQLYNKNPVVVMNCPNRYVSDRKNLFRQALGISDKAIIFLYQGGMGRNRGIEAILECFKNISDPDKIIVFMGFGELVPLVQEAAKKHTNIYFHPAVGTSELLDYTSSADVGIVYYENTCLNHEYALPNKLFEYMSAGIAILSSDLQEIRKIIEASHIGVVVEGGGTQDLARAVDQVTRENIAAMKENSRKAAEQYNWEAQEKILLGVYKDIK